MALLRLSDQAARARNNHPSLLLLNNNPLRQKAGPPGLTKADQVDGDRASPDYMNSILGSGATIGWRRHRSCFLVKRRHAACDDKRSDKLFKQFLTSPRPSRWDPWQKFIFEVVDMFCMSFCIPFRL